jgi:hypothetical protein
MSMENQNLMEKNLKKVFHKPKYKIMTIRFSSIAIAAVALMLVSGPIVTTFPFGGVHKAFGIIKIIKIHKKHPRSDSGHFHPKKFITKHPKQHPIKIIRFGHPKKFRPIKPIEGNPPDFKHPLYCCGLHGNPPSCNMCENPDLVR